jgi:MATE family multidrug resistance protein
MKHWYHTYKYDFKQNLNLAIPIIGGQLGQVLVNLADNVMVGWLGATSLAGISTGNSIFMLFMIVGMGMSYALPPLVAEADGSKDYHKVSLYFRHSVFINMVFTAFCILMLLLIIRNLNLIGLPEDVTEATKPYLSVSAWSMIPYMMFLTLRGVSDGFSRTSYAMGAILVGNILNVVFNYLLIYGKFGFPAMGLEGAAIASLMARVGMLVTLLYFIYKNDALWPFITEGYRSALQLPLIRKILNLAIPSSLQMFFEASAFSVAALIMGRVGKNEQAGHQIALSLASMTFLIATGLAMAATIRVSNAYGKKDKTGMVMAGNSALILVSVFMAATALIFTLFRFYLPMMYIDQTEVIQMAAFLLIFAAIFQIPDGIQVTAIGILRGVQDVKIPTLITFIAYWVIGLPVSYFSALYWGLGAGGVWLGLLIGLSVSGSLLVWRFWRRVRKDMAT